MTSELSNFRRPRKLLAKALITSNGVNLDFLHRDKFNVKDAKSNREMNSDKFFLNKMCKK